MTETSALTDGENERARRRPRVDWYSPDGEDANVSRAEPIRIRFTERMDASTLPNGVMVTDSSGAALTTTGALSSDGRTWTVTYSGEPSRVNIAVSSAAKDRRGNSVRPESWSFAIPSWYRLDDRVGEPNRSSRVRLAIDSHGTPWIAYRIRSDGDFRVRVRRYARGEWREVGTLLGDTDVAGFDFALEQGLHPVVAWTETPRRGQPFVQTKRWNGSAWRWVRELEKAEHPTLALDEQGRVLLAVRDLAAAYWVRRLKDLTWESIGGAIAHGGGDAAPLALSANGGLFASWGVTGQLRLASWSGGAWNLLSSNLAAKVGASRNPSLVFDPVTASLLVGFEELDGVGTNVRVRRVDPVSGATSDLEGPLDVELSALSRDPRLAVDAQGIPYVGWFEQYGSAQRHHVARWSGLQWDHVGTALDAGAADAFEGALAIDASRTPLLAWTAERRGDSVLRVARFNGGTPTALPIQAAVNTPCTLPAAPPLLLSQTRCFKDLKTRTPAAGVVPYSINSSLWSDGAEKRRYIVLPPGTTLTPTPSGSWDVPDGAFVIKEFMIERIAGDATTLVPMETRFFVRRNATLWEGYSYKWNAQGTEAVLLPGLLEETHVWPQWVMGSFTQHRHTYPSRAQCLRCHRRVANSLLGVGTAQLNRRFDYGGVVENQLRALSRAGLVPASVDPLTSPRLTAPYDLGKPLESRARAYMEGNCAQCHRPGGVGPRDTDFRHETPLAVSGLCFNSRVVPGDPTGSKLHLRMNARPGMPPLSTLKVDTRAVSLMDEWIASLNSCP